MNGLVRTNLSGIELEALEYAVRRKVLQIAARFIERHLNLDFSDYTGASCACRCGKQARYVDRRAKQFETILGPLTLERAYYHCGHCKQGFCPRDRILGLENCNVSNGLSRMIGHAAARASFEEGSVLLHELAAVDVSAKQVERIAERLGEQIEQYEREDSEPISESQAKATMYLGMDGTGVPMRAAELEGRVGKQPDGRAKTREVKLVTIWTADSCDREGKPVRDKGSVSYSAAIESARATDTDQTLSEFTQRASREANRREFYKASRQVVLGDGAPWIWNIAAELFPKAIQIVDRFHAKEHLSEIAKVIWGADSKIGKDWLHERYLQLDSGNIDQLIKSFAIHKRYPEVKRCIKYLKQNCHRMQYAYFHQQGLCTSSGVLEAGCKVAIGTRLKRAGMHWSLRGSNAIIALRCCILSARFEDFWEQRSGAAA